MKALGDFLRQAREAAGISLQEIQEKTKIRQYYLEAMESGNLEALPGEVYEKGFLRNYAMAVGIDEEEVMGLYHQLKTAKATPIETEGGESVSIPVREQPVAATKSGGSPRSYAFGKLVPVIVLFGIIVGVSIGWALIHKQGKKVEPVAGTVQTGQPQPTAHSANPKPKPENVVNDLLRLRAEDNVWIRLTEKDSGRLIEEVTLHQGDVREWKVDRALVLLNGNAGGLRISVFGSPFKAYGKPGEVMKTPFLPRGEGTPTNE